MQFSHYKVSLGPTFGVSEPPGNCGNCDAFPLGPQHLPRGWTWPLGVTVGSGLIIEALGRRASGRGNRAADADPPPSPALASATIALHCRRLGLSPASLSSCRAALLSSASRPRPRRLPPARHFGAMLPDSVTQDSRVGLQRVSVSSFRPEAGHIWPRPLTRVGPRPPKVPPPPCKLRWRKGTKLIHVYIQ